MVVKLETEDKLEYKFVPTTKQAVKFKIKAPNDAHIAITLEQSQATIPVYEVCFGGYSNQKSTITKNRTQPDVVVVETPSILDGNNFKEFWITWYDGTIEAGANENQTPILSWSDPEMFIPKFIGFSTRSGAKGSWIIEENWPGWRPHQSPILPGWDVSSIPNTGPTWVHSSSGSVPSNAVPCGIDKEQIFIGRGTCLGALLPGKVYPSQHICYVAWEGSEQAIHDYEVLCGCQPKWIPSSADHIPYFAYPAGKTDTGETVFIARAHYNDLVIIGRYQKSNRVCYIPHDGQEIPRDHFDIMIL